MAKAKTLDYQVETRLWFKHLSVWSTRKVGMSVRSRGHDQIWAKPGKNSWLQVKNSQKPVKTSKKDTFRQWIKNWDSHCLKYYYWCYYSKDCCCSAKHKQFITVANTNYYTKKQGRMSAATSVFCIIAKWAAETNSRVALRRDLQKKTAQTATAKEAQFVFHPYSF